VPKRGDVAVFAAIENATTPLPLPAPPEVIVSHESLLAAVQLHPAAVVTLALDDPPAAAGLSDDGDTLNVQGAGAPACVTVTV
jgi:hypothetical protein